MAMDFKDFIKEYSSLMRHARSPFIRREYNTIKYTIILSLLFLFFELILVYFIIPINNDMQINVTAGKILFPIAFIIGIAIYLTTIKIKKYFVYTGTIFFIIMGLVQIAANISSSLFFALIVLAVTNFIFMKILGTDYQ